MEGTTHAIEPLPTGTDLKKVVLDRLLSIQSHRVLKPCSARLNSQAGGQARIADPRREERGGLR
jgi:hypothetical protein